MSSGDTGDLPPSLTSYPPLKYRACTKCVKLMANSIYHKCVFPLTGDTCEYCRKQKQACRMPPPAFHAIINTLLDDREGILNPPAVVSADLQAEMNRVHADFQNFVTAIESYDSRRARSSHAARMEEIALWQNELLERQLRLAAGDFHFQRPLPGGPHQYSWEITGFVRGQPILKDYDHRFGGAQDPRRTSSGGSSRRVSANLPLLAGAPNRRASRESSPMDIPKSNEM